MILEFHPSAVEEIREAFRRLEDVRAGLGEDFLTEIRAHVERIQVDPESLPLLETTSLLNVRRSFIRRFQYLIVFEMNPQRILIIAIAHAARRIDYWADRLSSN